jgi:hypothetical protein
MFREFRDTSEDQDAYIAALQKGEGFIANCASGYPNGYMFHRASCTFLDAHKTRNPIHGTTGKIWATTLPELEANAPHSQTCRCLQM